MEPVSGWTKISTITGILGVLRGSWGWIRDCWARRMPGTVPMIPIRNSVPLLIRKTAPLEVVVGGRAGWAHMRTRLGTRLFLRGVDGARECGEAVSPRSALGRGRGR